MKPVADLLQLLRDELNERTNEIRPLDKGTAYYNKVLGDTSFLLAGILGLLLKKNHVEWETERWIDDSLISNVIIQNNKLRIEGVMIWGRMDVTEQWTEPFLFTTDLFGEKVTLDEFIFLFGDTDYPEITYEEFKGNNNYWETTNRDRNWKYKMNYSRMNSISP